MFNKYFNTDGSLTDVYPFDREGMLVTEVEKFVKNSTLAEYSPLSDLVVLSFAIKVFSFEHRYNHETLFHKLKKA